jgi:3',5'-cyclic AMP phosphodiesterase CpdA
MRVRFAIVNDIHLGSPESGYIRGIQRKLVGRAEPLVADFVAAMNEDVRPLFVVNLGDAIEDAGDPAVDRAHLERAAGLLAGLRMPSYSLLGNHDAHSIPAEEAAAILGSERSYFAFDASGFHFAALGFAGARTPSGTRAVVPDEQLEWLAADLAAGGRPTVVFCHHGLADDSMAGNFWFDGNPEGALIANRADVRGLLERSGRVRAVISAHQHWNRLLVHGGIPYITVTSLVENTRNDGVAAGAWSVVDLDDEGIVVDVRGNDPARLEHRFSGRRR